LVLRDERHPQASFAVLAGSGCYSRFAGAGEVPTLDPHLLALIGGAFERRCHDFCDERSVIYIQTGSGREVVVLLESPKCLSETDRKLVEVFCSRLSIAFDNVLLYQQLQDANARLEERVTQRTAELTAANDRLATQGRRLREANRFKGEILGTVAHDLKNPLGVIMGRAEMLTDLLGLQPPALDGARAQIDHIRDSAKRLTGMVDALISDAMSDALDISIRSQTIDLVALVDRVVEANRPLAERKDQVVEVRKPEALVATGDPDRLQEAVDNLVSNAVKYGPVGSAITVEVKARGDRNAIAVHDEGPGLSPEDIARLFGRFQRLSAKPTAGESSTGLGLSIAKRIVELHGGSIETESRGPGQGATFTILLPAEARPPAGARP
jgi:signal transduction histidine kinase